MDVRRPFDCIFFDLDDTLFDTDGQLVAQAVRRSFNAFQEQGLEMPWEEFARQRQLFMSQSPERDFFQHIGAQNGLSQSAAERAHRAFYNYEVREDIHAFPGVTQLLEQLHGVYALHLVTSGNAPTQQRKVQILGLGQYFEKIWCVDHLKFQDKKSIFQQILTHYGFPPQRTLSVGNRLDHEIRQAKELGCTTCHINHGEYRAQKPQCAADHADFLIDQIDQLIEVCGL